MNRKTYLMIVIVIVLIIIAVLSLYKPGERSRTADEVELLVSLDSATVDKFEIKSQFGEFTLAKEGIQWLVIKPLRYPADERKIASALGHCLNMKIKSVVSTNPEKQSTYKVDSSGMQIKIFQGGVEKIDFVAGKAAGTPLQTFVRKPGSNEVMIVHGALSYVFNVPLKDWRKKTIIAIHESEIQEIDFKYGDESFSLTLNDTLWTVEGAPADQKAAADLIKTLTDYTTDFFVDEKPDTIPETSAVVSIGNKQISFAQIDEERYYVRCSETPQLFMILNWKAKKLLKKKEDLLPLEE